MVQLDGVNIEYCGTFYLQYSLLVLFMQSLILIYILSASHSKYINQNVLYCIIFDNVNSIATYFNNTNKTNATITQYI